GAERLRSLTPHHGSPELFAEPDFHGYGWYFTKGDFLNIGVGAVGGMPIAQRLERFRTRLRESGRWPASLELTRFRAPPPGTRFLRGGDRPGGAQRAPRHGRDPSRRPGELSGAQRGGVRQAVRRAGRGARRAAGARTRDRGEARLHPAVGPAAPRPRGRFRDGLTGRVAVDPVLDERDVLEARQAADRGAGPARAGAP